MVATILAPNKKKAVMWVRNLEPGFALCLSKAELDTKQSTKR